MGHNSVVSGHQKSPGIPRVNGLSTGPSYLRRHTDLGVAHHLCLVELIENGELCEVC